MFGLIWPSMDIASVLDDPSMTETQNLSSVERQFLTQAPIVLYIVLGSKGVGRTV